jgi:hypothetical protein
MGASLSRSLLALLGADADGLACPSPRGCTTRPARGRQDLRALASDDASRLEPRSTDAGEIFPMNCDEPASLDSQYFGPLPVTAIMGRAIALWTSYVRLLVSYCRLPVQMLDGDQSRCASAASIAIPWRELIPAYASPSLRSDPHGPHNHCCALTVDPKVMHAFIWQQSGGERWSFSVPGERQSCVYRSSQDGAAGAHRSAPPVSPSVWA